jgi:hypothetical protein
MIEPDKQRKLIASLRLLSSDNEGERNAALLAVKRLLPPGATLADLVPNDAPPPRPEVKVPDFNILRTAHLGAGQ